MLNIGKTVPYNTYDHTRLTKINDHWVIQIVLYLPKTSNCSIYITFTGNLRRQGPETWKLSFISVHVKTLGTDSRHVFWCDLGFLPNSSQLCFEINMGWVCRKCAGSLAGAEMWINKEHLTKQKAHSCSCGLIFDRCLVCSKRRWKLFGSTKE